MLNFGGGLEIIGNAFDTPVSNFPEVVHNENDVQYYPDN